MAPPQTAFAPAELAEQIQKDLRGKNRKVPVKLEECELKKMTQYRCWIAHDGPTDKRGTVMCRPITRLFRLCEAGFMVETTAWEELKTTQ